MELREQILEATISVFNVKGIKFTMDDLAKKLGMSKKTIYTVFKDKQELFLAMVDYLFDAIKDSEQRIMENTSMSTLDKIRVILNVLPEGYKEIDFRQLYTLKDKYPSIYKQVEMRLESGWESTILLLEKGIEEGVIRKVNIFLVKMMMESSLEQFFQRDILIQNGITYQEALDEIVNIILEGIIIPKQKEEST